MDYYEKLYNVSLNNNLAQQCFEVFKRLAKKSTDEQHKSTILKYFGRILIQKELTLEDEHEDLVSANVFVEYTYMKCAINELNIL